MADQSTTPKRTYTGSCHCKAITYKVNLAIGPNPSATRCNCTICLKSAFTPYHIPSDSDFTLVTPASFADLSSYQFNSTDVNRYFCNKCGIHVLWKGNYVLEGRQIEFFTINLVTLDQPEGEGLDLSTFRIGYWDGRHDNWKAEIKNGPWPHGIV